MDALLAAIDLKQLGISGVLLGYLIYTIHGLREELRDERGYSRELNEKYQALAQRTIETMGRMEQAFILLRDGLK